jgi:hypothetical protein
MCGKSLLLYGKKACFAEVLQSVSRLYRVGNTSVQMSPICSGWFGFLHRGASRVSALRTLFAELRTNAVHRFFGNGAFG